MAPRLLLCPGIFTLLTLLLAHAPHDVARAALPASVVALVAHDADADAAASSSFVPTFDDLVLLAPLGHQVRMVDEMAQRGEIDEKVVETVETRLTEAARATILARGNPRAAALTPALLRSFHMDDLALGGESTIWSRLSAVISVTNVVAVVAACLLVMALRNAIELIMEPLRRLSRLLWRLICSVPVQAYEMAAYILLWYLVAVAALWSDADVAPLVVLPAALALPILWVTSAKIHSPGGGDRSAFIKLVAFDCAIVYIAIADMLNSSLIGLLAAMCLSTLLGFQMHAYGLCYTFGFREQELASGTAGAGLVIAIYAGLVVTSTWLERLAPFRYGIGLVVGLVFHIGMLICSSRFVRRADKASWATCNATYVLVALGLLYLTGAYPLGPLRGVVGTMGVFFAMDKWAELPFPPKLGRTLGLAGLSGILYGSAIYLRHNPDLMISFT